jgi:uroporphyrinogen decarboxylase
LELVKQAGSDVIGVDWRINLDAAWNRLGDDVAVQGNLEPCALFLPKDKLEERVKEVLDQAGNRPGHIFNLGHGILPQASVENAKFLVEVVHEYSVKR